MKEKYFDYERLDVYQVAVEFIVLTEEIIENLPRGRAYLADQFQRASTSILLNIAEGAGESSSNEKIRFYRMSRRSATECAGIIEIVLRLGIIKIELHCKARELLIRIVSMLSKMTLGNGSETATQTQTFTKKTSLA